MPGLMLALTGGQRHSGAAITMCWEAVGCGGFRHHARRASLQVLALGSPSTSLKFSFPSEEWKKMMTPPTNEGTWVECTCTQHRVHSKHGGDHRGCF